MKESKKSPLSVQPPPREPDHAGERDPKASEVGAKVIRRALGGIGADSGVYQMIGADGQVLYVGKARQLRNRVQSYVRVKQLSRRIALMVAQVRAVKVIVTHTEAEALLLEAELIKRHHPRFNLLLRDDKSYPEVLLRGDHPYPQVMKHRGSHTTKGRYFGPYANVSAVNEALDALQKCFRLRNCSDNVFAHRSRPCLLYDVKRCSAPCVGKISHDEYAVLVRQAEEFLSGRSVDVQAELADEMQRASDEVRYEDAAEIRDRLAALTAIQKRSSLPAPHPDSADVMAIEVGSSVSCVYVAMFRHGRHCGAQGYFLSHRNAIVDSGTGGETDREAENHQAGVVLGSFIGQFYQRREVPRLLLLNRWPENAPLIAEALRRHGGHPIAMHVPQRGDKFRLMGHIQASASKALAQRTTENSRHDQQWQALASLLGVDDLRRIEAYDNSHFGGKQSIGVMVVANAEGFDRSHYRKFNISGDHAPGDDLKLMEEMLTRRLRRLIESDSDQHRPDLLLIDGGTHQYQVGLQAVTEAGLAGQLQVAAIVKGAGRDARRDRILFQNRTLSVRQASEAGLLLQRLRDEAHRFAIGGQRARRGRSLEKSRLDEVAGIGRGRKQKLLRHFGSVKAVQQAGIEDIAAVEGISRTLAGAIYRHFRA